MDFSDNFYKDILEKEKYWNYMIEKKLLNIYYIVGPDGLKDFYLGKREELISQPNISNNPILIETLDRINSILAKIDTMYQDFKNGKQVYVEELSNMFLSNMVNANVNSKSDLTVEQERILRQQVRDTIKAYLENIKSEYVDTQGQYQNETKKVIY